ncbi:WD40 repeat domain-containing protein [Streptomyces collinus]|uniref:WD40 repeat domain-containing protein n=1 Tax=Streptomyces collinus TaxID=42684 RepID=UPI003424CB63
MVAGLEVVERAIGRAQDRSYRHGPPTGAPIDIGAPDPLLILDASRARARAARGAHRGGQALPARNWRRLIRTSGSSVGEMLTAVCRFRPTSATTRFSQPAASANWGRGSSPGTFAGQFGPVSLAAISPDGTWLATRSLGGAVRLWDRASGRCTTTLTSVAISPDGTWLAGVCKSGEIRIWNVRSRAIATIVRTDGFLAGCTWASHNWTFVAVGSRGLHLFELRT